MNITKSLPLLIVASAILSGCINKSTSVQIDQPTQNTQSTPPDNTGVSETSSGDADQDIAEIEAALDSLDADQDFPTFNASDFEE